MGRMLPLASVDAQDDAANTQTKQAINILSRACDRTNLY